MGEIEELNSSSLIVDIKHCRCPTNNIITNNDDCKEGAEHDEGLEGVCPYDCLDTSDTSIKDANQKYNGTCELYIIFDTIQEACNLDESKCRGIHHYSHVQHHLDTKQEGDEHPHPLVEPDLQVLIAGADT